MLTGGDGKWQVSLETVLQVLKKSNMVNLEISSLPISNPQRIKNMLIWKLVCDIQYSYNSPQMTQLLSVH